VKCFKHLISIRPIGGNRCIKGGCQAGRDRRERLWRLVIKMENVYAWRKLRYGSLHQMRFFLKPGTLIWLSITRISLVMSIEGRVA